MNEHYFVTGATGFVGSNIVRQLVHSNKHVSIIVRNKKLNWRLKDIQNKISIFESDLLNTNLQTIVAKIKPTHIYHLAAYGALPKDESVEQMFHVNVQGTINLIQAVSKYPFKVFINTGSSSEYGIKEKAMQEADILKPINDYGVSKAAATLYCQKEALRLNIPLITFRLFAVYGQFEENSRFIPYTIHNALQNKSLEFSSPDNVRDFIHVDDVVRAYLEVPKKNNPGAVYNIGSGKQHTLKEACDIILNITKSHSKVTWNKKEGQLRQIEPKIWQANIAKAKRELQWQPQISFRKGLVETVEWYKSHI